MRGGTFVSRFSRTLTTDAVHLLPRRTIFFFGLTITRLIKPLVTRHAPVTLEWDNTPGNNKEKWYTYKAIHASAQNIKSENGSQPVHVPGLYWYIRFNACI